MHKLSKLICLVISIMSIASFASSSAKASTKTSTWPADNRTQLPGIFNHSFIGMQFGAGDFGFTNRNVPKGLEASKIDKNLFSVQPYFGHYFNRYLAMQVSLMRPVYWIGFNRNTAPKYGTTIWESIFGLSLKPTLPINSRLSIYGVGGLALTSRHGFSVGSRTVISSQTVPNVLLGAGLSVRLYAKWHLNLYGMYIPGNKADNQPRTLFGSAGLYYLFSHSDNTKETDTTPKDSYIFPHNNIQFGFFEKSWFNVEAYKWFSSKYFPIFWDGSVHTRNDYYLMYQRNFFHTRKYLSLYWGVSAARMESDKLGQSIYTVSIFPGIRLWLIRSQTADFYFTYELAGPSYISRTRVDNKDTGEHFTFQDYMGIGLFLGKSKRFNVNFKIIHYSNGNLFPQNPGIANPVTLNIGYTF